MPMRLVALDEGLDIVVDEAMIVVGRHPACDARLDAIRVSRHHCCLRPSGDALGVKDLGSRNGIRINGQRVMAGRLRPGDVLSIANLRYQLEGGAPGELAPEDEAAENSREGREPSTDAHLTTRPIPGPPS